MQTVETPLNKPFPVGIVHPKSLCHTCIHSRVCIYIRKFSKPVIECEEFECEGAPEKKRHFSETTARAEEDQYQGLCMNCLHRKTCIQAKTVGGIWHCENYE